MKERLKNYSRKLRKNLTYYEIKLWQQLRNRRFHGLKFRRQQVIWPYIVDFFCLEKKLIIELDGGGHLDETQTFQDIKRDLYLKQQGYQVLRFWNDQMHRGGLFKILAVIGQACEVIGLSISGSLIQRPLTRPSGTLSRRERG